MAHHLHDILYLDTHHVATPSCKGSWTYLFCRWLWAQLYSGICTGREEQEDANLGTTGGSTTSNVPHSDLQPNSSSLTGLNTCSWRAWTPDVWITYSLFAALFSSVDWKWSFPFTTSAGFISRFKWHEVSSLAQGLTWSYLLLTLLSYLSIITIIIKHLSYTFINTVNYLY